jgi:TetR/AcrR family transcriptional regulator, transcriptional repressor for nem operon
MARPQEFDTAEALHQAMGVFWRRGFEAATLAELLDPMGLSKSSLYGTFGGKRELFLAAFDAYREERARDMDRVLGEGSARVAIERFFRMIVADARAPEFTRGCMSINQAVEMGPHDPEVRDRVEADFQRMEDALTHAVIRGQWDGSVVSSRPARDLAQLLVLAFPGLQVMVRAGRDKARLDDTLRVLLSTLD